MAMKLDFDDVLIVPQFSDITSRSQVQLDMDIVGKWGTTIHGVPIVAANMDGVGTFSMHHALKSFGAFTAITKHCSDAEWIEQKDVSHAFLTLGMSDQDLAKAEHIVEFFTNTDASFVPKIIIDVANGYMNPLYDFIARVRDRIPNAFIMAGNVVTPEACERIINAGADLARVGIGSGAVCTTRRVAGVGYPQFSALLECVPAAEQAGGGVQSDGGCVYPGDFSKAFAAGAHMVMAGSIFAGHDESEQDIHDGKIVFYGMSSAAAQEKHNQVKNYRASEGRVVQIPYKGPVKHTMSDILGGIRSTCAYMGAQHVFMMPEKAEFIQVNHQLNGSLEQY